MKPLNISAVSSQSSALASQLQLSSSRAALAQQAVASASGAKPDGDGDHGVEPNASTPGTKTGQLLNALA